MGSQHHRPGAASLEPADPPARALTRGLIALCHELRTLLYVIAGSVELLDAAELEPNERHHLLVHVRRGLDDVLDLVARATLRGQQSQSV